jgi:phosphatidate cytidylyltransferase
LTVYESSGAPTPAKLSKTAQKKAARAARLEKKQMTANKLQLTEFSSIEHSAPYSEESPQPYPVESQNSLDVSARVKSLSPVQMPPATDVDAQLDHQEMQPLSMDSKWITQKADPFYRPTSKLAEQLLNEDINSDTAHPKVDVREAEQTRKMQNVITRTLWTFIMIGGFIGMFRLCPETPYVPQFLMNFCRIITAWACVSDSSSHVMSKPGLQRSDCTFFVAISRARFV